MKMPWSKTAPETTRPAPTDVEAIKAKLADCRGEVEAAERDLQRASLSAVLGDRETDASEAARHLAQLRGRRELLCSALQAAEQAEIDARDALSGRDFAARKRALSQHIGRIERDATDLTAALTALRDAFRRIAATGQTITALLPASMRNEAQPFHELLSAPHLRDLANVEALRLSRGGLVAPGVTASPMLLAQYEDRVSGAIKPLGEVLDEIIANLKREFEARAPSSSPDLVKLALAQVPVDVSAIAPTDTVLPRTLDSRGEVLDLRGVDLGIEKRVESEASEEEATA